MATPRPSLYLALSLGSALLFLAPSVFAQPAETQPAPASIGTDIPATYFGPPPSAVMKELIGPYTLLKSATLDLEKGTATIPLYRGSLRGANKKIWYVLTDTDDTANAASLGVNPSNKLTFAGRAARKAVLDRFNRLVFDKGYVDFSPEHKLVAGPTVFPPSEFQPGAVGDAHYTPVVVIKNAGYKVWNAPIVAGDVDPEQLSKYCGGINETDKMEAYKILHDKVLAICPSEDGYGGTVTLQLTTGFSFGRPVLYVSLDASKPLTATLEAVTYSSALDELNLNEDDNFGSGLERIFVITNGYSNKDIPMGANETLHPLRQGLISAIQGEGGPLNILGGIPTVATDYSPLWKLNLGEWTPHAVASNYRTRNLDEFGYLGQVARGLITAPGGGEFGSADAGVTNCPIVHRFL